MRWPQPEEWLRGAALMEDLVNLRINTVIRNYFTKCVLPLPNALAADAELVGDLLAALAIGKGLQETPEGRSAVAFNKIARNALPALGRRNSHVVLPWNI
jgi:hypothetical protein